MGWLESSVSKALSAKPDWLSRQNQLLQIVPRVPLALCTCRHTDTYVNVRTLKPKDGTDSGMDSR